MYALRDGGCPCAFYGSLALISLWTCLLHTVSASPCVPESRAFTNLTNRLVVSTLIILIPFWRSSLFPHLSFFPAFLKERDSCLVSLVCSWHWTRRVGFPPCCFRITFPLPLLNTMFSMICISLMNKTVSPPVLFKPSPTGMQRLVINLESSHCGWLTAGANRHYPMCPPVPSARIEQITAKGATRRWQGGKVSEHMITCAQEHRCGRSSGHHEGISRANKSQKPDTSKS